MKIPVIMMFNDEYAIPSGVEVWYYYLTQTPFFQEQMKKLLETQIKHKKKKSIFGKLQQYKRKIFTKV